MKRTLLFFCLFVFFTFTCFNRYTPITLQEAKPTLMQVEIKGAIQNPGVYTLKRNSSISSLIQVSGGLFQALARPLRKESLSIAKVTHFNL